ncbi:MAG TPA: hypothetical protein VGK24_14520 [Candidatus Angelobacter sp.]|jgi:hypothetical protein
MTELKDLMARVDKLESSNKVLRVLLTVTVLTAGLLIVLGVAAPIPSVLEAQKFVLKDASGHERGSLFTSGTTSGLVLYNPDSSRAAAFVASPGGNSTMLMDHKGNARAFIYVSDDESNLALFDLKTKQPKIELKNAAPGSALVFRDDNGTDRISVGFAPTGGAVLLNDANSTSRTAIDEDAGLTKFDAKGDFIWMAGFDALDKDEQKRVRDVIQKSLPRSR